MGVPMSARRRAALLDFARTFNLRRTAGVGPDQLEPEGVRGVVQHPGIVTPSRVDRVTEHANSGDVRRCLL